MAVSVRRDVEGARWKITVVGWRDELRTTRNHVTAQHDVIEALRGVLRAAGNDAIDMVIITRADMLTG